MTEDRVRRFEELPGAAALDETDRSLRAYVAGLADAHLAKYDPSWADEGVRTWDGNFRSDGALMLVCCERDVGVEELRRVVEECLAYRGRVNGTEPRP